MAVDLSKLALRNKIEIGELNGKRVAIDAYNVLYQFISIIRQPDGTPLHDSNGEVTSHLSGIFYRTIEMVEKGIEPIYVFDGIPSKLKERTISARIKRREEAYSEWQKAKESGRIEEARSYAEQSARVDRKIVESSKELLNLMGIPHINAPSEGEAQASVMCRDGLVYAAASQDYDTLLFGASVVIRNLTLSGRRKLPKKNVYVDVFPERVDLEETLKGLGINRKQLIWVGIMLGTDFNSGVKGIGPKTALKIVRGIESIDELESVLKKRGAEFESDPREVEQLFLNPEVKKMDKKELDSVLATSADIKGLVDFMCAKHDFSEDRIKKFAERLGERDVIKRQKGIDAWMG